MGGKAQLTVCGETSAPRKSSQETAVPSQGQRLRAHVFANISRRRSQTAGPRGDAGPARRTGAADTGGVQALARRTPPLKQSFLQIPFSSSASSAQWVPRAREAPGGPGGPVPARPRPERREGRAGSSAPRPQAALNSRETGLQAAVPRPRRPARRPQAALPRRPGLTTTNCDPQKPLVAPLPLPFSGTLFTATEALGNLQPSRLAERRGRGRRLSANQGRTPEYPW